MRRGILIFIAAAGFAAVPAGFEHYKAADLKAMPAKLAAKMDANKSAFDWIGRWGNHGLMMSHREGSGEAELHETQADIFFVNAGAATLVIGGEMVNAKTTAPGELRGPSIKGGEKVKLAPGDIVHIPAKQPHQLLLAPGAKFDYTIVKITE